MGVGGKLLCGCGKMLTVLTDLTDVLDKCDKGLFFGVEKSCFCSEGLVKG